MLNSSYFPQIWMFVTEKQDKEGQDCLSRSVFVQVRVCVCMLLSKYAFLFEPCADIKCGLTIAHCPVSLPRFLSRQNSRKLGHRANKQRRPRLSAGASGLPGRTPAWTAGVGGSNSARKLISVASLRSQPKGDTFYIMHEGNMEKGAAKGCRAEELQCGLGMKDKTRNGGDFPTNSTLVISIM